MESLKIGTWNIKNSYFNIKKNKIKAKAIVDLIDKEELDVLTLQEVNPLLVRKIEKELDNRNKEVTSIWHGGYHITSTYSKTLFPIANLVVEQNIIISKLQEMTYSENKKLPFLPKGFELLKNLPSIRHRHTTEQDFNITTINDEYFNIRIVTTHLDYRSEELNATQLDTIYRNIETDGTPTFITGNLNSKASSSNILFFEKCLSKKGITLIKPNGKTYINHTDNEPVDYIGVSNDYNIGLTKIVDGYEDVSTHKPVVTEAYHKKYYYSSEPTVLF